MAVGEQGDHLIEEIGPFLIGARDREGLSLAKIQRDGLADRSAVLRAEALARGVTPAEALLVAIVGACELLTPMPNGVQCNVAAKLALNLAPEISDRPKLGTRLTDWGLRGRRQLGRWVDLGTRDLIDLICRSVEAGDLSRLFEAAQRRQSGEADPSQDRDVHAVRYDIRLDHLGRIFQIAREIDLTPRVDNFWEIKVGNKYEGDDGVYRDAAITYLSEGRASGQGKTLAGSTFTTIKFKQPKPRGIPFTFRIERAYDVASIPKPFVHLTTVRAIPEVRFALRWHEDAPPRHLWHYEDIFSSNAPLAYAPDRAIDVTSDRRVAIWSGSILNPAFCVGIGWSFSQNGRMYGRIRR